MSAKGVEIKVLWANEIGLYLGAVEYVEVQVASKHCRGTCGEQTFESLAFSIIFIHVNEVG